MPYRPLLSLALVTSAIGLSACGSELDTSASDSDTFGESEGSESEGTTDEFTTDEPTEGPTSDGPTTDAPTTDASTTDDPSETTDDPSETTDDPSETTDDPSETTGDPSETTDDPTDSTTGDPVPEPVIPVPTGDCPVMEQGTLTFSPAGLDKTRNAQVWMNAWALEVDGPVVFYWHGTGSNPNEALYGLGQEGIAEIVDKGGIVVAPYHDPDAGQFPWYLVLGQQEDDLILADEILGCAHEQTIIDSHRIHSIGMSAGGLQTSQMSYRRSSYISSVVTYSGGIFGQAPPSENPDNKFGAMIYHGGPTDIVVISFQDAGEMYRDDLQQNDHFAFICDHGNGHTIPQDGVPSSVDFLLAHPWGQVPSPYENGLPDSFPDYCAL